MATEAETARQARANVISADGEMKAAQAFREAAAVISESPVAVQLRQLQTMATVADKKQSTIVFPLPIDFGHF